MGTDKNKIEEWERETLEKKTPLLKELEKYRKARQKTRMMNLTSRNNSLPTQIQGQDSAITSYNRFLDTEEGKAQRESDKAEFPDLFDSEDDEGNGSEGDEGEDQPEDEEVLPEEVVEEDP